MFGTMTPSRVTVELGKLVESGFQLWDFDYPSYYKGEEKTAFEKKVVEHYYFRQIGQETPQRFRHYFQARIREIMPYYLQLYKSQEIMDAIDDPFGNVDVTETVRQTTSGERSGNASSENSNTMSAENSTSKTSNDVETFERDVDRTADATTRKLDTTQGEISNLDKYLTEGEKHNETVTDGEKSERESDVTETGSETASSSASGEGSETHSESHSETLEYTSTKKGNQGVNTYAHDMRELRETFLNIDMQIIEELADLFLLVY